MSCNQLCAIINNSICMNLCAMGLEPSGYRFTKQGSYWLLTHSELKEPLARLHQTEHLAVEQLQKHLVKLDKVTPSKDR